jgi:hypothetical protein
MSGGAQGSSQGSSAGPTINVFDLNYVLIEDHITILHTQVVLDALDMALQQRRPNGVIHHSDHGSQYTSIEFGNRCREAGVRPSI